MTFIALLFSIVLSSASLAWGFSQSGFSSFSTFFLLLGIGWFFSIWQEWQWYASFTLFVFVSAAALGLWFGFTPGWMFAGGIFVLLAWEMSNFRHRLRLISNDKDLRGIERRHLLRVSLLVFVGLLLSNIAMFFVRASFTFEWGMLLLVITLLGLGQLPFWLRK